MSSLHDIDTHCDLAGAPVLVDPGAGMVDIGVEKNTPLFYVPGFAVGAAEGPNENPPGAGAVILTNVYSR